MTPAQPARPPRDLRPVAVTAAAVAAFTNLYAPQAILPLLSQEFGAGAAQASLAMTACTLAVALTAPFSGALSDVTGRKRMIAGAMVALVVPTLLLAFAPSLGAFNALRFAQGLLLPPIFATLIAYIGEEWPPDQATRVTGFYVAAASFGGFLGRFLTGVLADAIGWRGAFAVDAAVTLVCAVMVVTLLPQERAFVRATHIAQSLRQMLAHLRNPQLLATYAIGFGVLFNFVGSLTYVNFHLAAPPFNLTATFLGAIFVTYLLGTAFVPLTGKAVARLGRRRFVLLALGLWLAGILLTLVASLPVIILGLACSIVAGFFCQACSTSYVAITGKAGGASTAVGLYVTAFYLGGSVGGALPGFAWNYAEWPGVVAVVIAMLAVMATLVVTVWPRQAQP